MEEDGIPGQREMERRSMKQKFVTWMRGMPLSFVKGNMRTVNYFFQRSIICSLEVNINTSKKS